MIVRKLTGGPVTVTPSAWDVTEGDRLIGRISVKDGVWFAWSILRCAWSEQADRAGALEFVQGEARAQQPTLIGA